MPPLRSPTDTHVSVACSVFFFVVTQGSAFAWMLNGLIQSMNSGIIPGNRNLDNPDGVALRKFDRLVYLEESTNVWRRPLKAAYAHSFGFGQAGAEAIIVHADHIFSAITSTEFTSYSTRRHARHAAANRAWLEWMTDRRSLIPIKSTAPFAESDMYSVFLSPNARAAKNLDTEQWLVSSTSTAGTTQAGGERTKLNLALKQLSKNISWKNLSSASRSSSTASFLHVDSKGEIANSPSSNQLQADGHGRSSLGGLALRRIDSAASFGASTSQDLMYEVPSSSPSSLGAGPSELSRPPSDVNLSSIGMTHSFSGLTLNSASMEQDTMTGVGVDVEEITTFGVDKDESWFKRNFTPAEIDYCRAQPNPSASFAGKWAAKEAVLKALSSLHSSSSIPGAASFNLLQGAGGALVDIEVLAPPGGGAPQVALKGQAEKWYRYLNLATIQLSIAHSGSHALSLATARSNPNTAPRPAAMHPIRSTADMAALIRGASSGNINETK